MLLCVFNIAVINECLYISNLILKFLARIVVFFVCIKRTHPVSFLTETAVSYALGGFTYIAIMLARFPSMIAKDVALTSNTWVNYERRSCKTKVAGLRVLVKTIIRFA